MCLLPLKHNHLGNIKTKKVMEITLSNGGTLEEDQIRSIFTGNAGNTASDEEVTEYLLDEGWDIEDIEELISKVHNYIND